MKVGFLSGAFRGPDTWQIHQNVCDAEKVAWEIWSSKRAAVICPHLNTAHFHGSLPDSVWLDGYIEILRKCDFLFGMAGCFRSEGAKAEIAEAEKLGMPIFYSLGELEWWLEQQETGTPIRDYAPTFGVLPEPS